MKCPVCQDVNLAMMERQGIEIDYCPQCRGVWLDRGELDRLIDGAARDSDRHGTTPPPRAHEERGYYKEHKYHKDERSPRRRSSFLGDLFDFD